MKNWVLFGNPFYPMYFGHQGVSDEAYQGLMNAIWQWEPKTIATFMSKFKRWWSYSGSTTYVSIWLAPFAALVNRKSKFLIILVGYYVLYIPYWFFLATHQTRFLLTGLVVASILTAILVARVSTRYLVGCLVGLVVIGFVYKPDRTITLWSHYLNTKLHLVERQYALGNIREREFLSREFGCQYNVVKYLEDNNLKGDVIDNWSVWHDPSVAYFATENNFVRFSSDDYSEEELLSELKSRNLRYLYLNVDTKDRYLDNVDVVVEKTKPGKIIVDEFVLGRSELMFEDGKCRLYIIAQ